ncbi:kinase-like domain-containing protein [Aspergillus unguis]
MSIPNDNLYATIPYAATLPGILGLGSIGVVYRHTADTVVKIPTRGLGTTAEELNEQIGSIQREAAVYNRLTNECPHIVKFLGSTPVSIVLEYAENGDLRDYLQKGWSYDNGTREWVRRVVPERERMLAWMKDIARGLAHIHSRRVLVNDLASRNLLLDRDMRIKFCDFSHAIMENSMDCPLDQMGDDRFGLDYDIGKVGSVFYEIIAGRKADYDGMLGVFETETGEIEKTMEAPDIGDIWLGWVIEKCWEEEYEDAEELLEDLEGIELDESEGDEGGLAKGSGAALTAEDMDDVAN